MDKETEEIMETTNINLAAAFLSNGQDAHLDESKVDRSDPRHVKVVVVGKRLEEIKRKWDTWELTVNARKYAAHLKDVKALIHAED